MPFLEEGQLGRRQPAGEGKVRLRFWVSLLILVAILIMAGLGQWDWALAGIIGLAVANAGASAIHWD
jgi:hypothetical protein